MQLFLFGKIRIQDGNGVQDQFSSHRAVGLLVYLVSLGQAVPRSELVELFWPDKPADRGSANLRWALNYLKKILPGCWEASRQTIQFKADAPCWVDMLTLRKGLESGDLALLTESIEEAQGEFCRGFYFDESPEFETWLLTQREYWREQLSSGWQQMIAAHNARGAFTAGLRLARRLLKLDSWQESAHRQVMLLLARTGDLNGALAQFQHCRRLLIDELGVEPQPETIALYERLRHLRSAPPPPLPSQPTPFVGRANALTQIEELLVGDGARLVTLLGLGGIGKTRLALAAAERLQQAFLEGVYFVPLATVTERSGLFLALAQSMNLQLRGESGVEAQVIEGVRDKELLLVLDNFEQLAAEAQALEPLLQAAPQVRVLVTSRERLNLRWERPFPLSGLSYPASPTDPDWQQTSSVRLFEQAAARACPGFALTTAERAAVSEICRLVEGFPLALELAAAGLRLQSPQALLDQIRADIDTLSTGMRDLPQRQRSLRAIFDAAYMQLPTAVQATFCRLPLFENSFTTAAARHVAEAPAAHLYTLVDGAILTPVPDSPTSTPRFTLHPLLRQYAAQKLATQPPAIQAAVAARQATYFLEALSAAEPRLRQGEDVAIQLQALFLDLENVLAAWRWAVSKQAFSLIKRALPGLHLYFELHGPFEEGVLLFRETLTLLADLALPPDDHKLLPSLHAAEANLLAKSGQFHQSAEAAQSGLALAEAQAAPLLRAQLSLTLATAYYGMGRLPEASETGKKTLMAAHTLQDTQLIAECQHMLATLAFIQGDFAQAQTRYQAAEAGHVEAQNLHAVTSVRHNLALIDFQQGALEAAEGLFHSALEAFRQTGNQRGISSSLHNLGLIAQHAGRHAEASRFMTEALSLRRQLGDLSGEAFTLANLAYISKQNGQISVADDQASEALSIAQQLSDRRTELYTRNILGIIAVEHGRYSNGWQHFSKNLALSEVLKSSGDESRARKGLGWTALRLGQFEAAEKHLQRGLTLAPQDDIYSEHSWLAGNLAELYLLWGRLSDVNPHLYKLEERLVDSSDLTLRGYILRLRAEYLRLIENMAGVKQAFEKALILWGEDAPLVEMRAILAAAYLDSEQVESALVQIERLLPALDANPDGLGIDDPEGVYLVCYQGLAAVGDRRAGDLLAQGFQLLQRRALRIREAEKRESYLQVIPSHHALLSAWRGVNGR